MNLRLGRWSRILAPGYSWCEKCGTPWRFVAEHVTDYTATRGIFPLCEKCWAELSPEERLPFYWAVWSNWPRENGDQWPLVRVAVLEGR